MPQKGLRKVLTIAGVAQRRCLLVYGTHSSDGRITAALLYSYDADGSLVSVNYNGTEYYYLRNGQNDVVGLVDGSGNTVVEYRYDAWGKLLSTTGSLASTLGVDNPIRYRGYYYDIETGLYYLESRYYDPEVCRFISSDVVLSTGQGVLGHNIFAYCINNPIVLMDPNGQTPIQVVFAALGAVAGWALGDYVAKKLGYSSGYMYWLIRAGVVVGGAVIGWFAAGALTAILKTFIFSSPKLIASTPIWIYKFLGISVGSGSVVLGKYPVYVSLAQKLGSSVFQVAKNVWDRMSAAAQWAANKAFLDKIISSGQKITFASNAYHATGYFKKEVEYLLAHGYVIIQYGWAMIKK